MKAALIIYGSLDTVSGGYLYDRMLVSKLRQRGDEVEVISQPRRSYALSLLDNLSGDSSPDVDVLIQDELNHPSLFLANRRVGRPPIVSIVHHLRSSEHRAAWQNSLYASIEGAYLRSVDGLIFNSETTRESVRALLGSEKPHVVATPGGDRLGSSSPEQVRARVTAFGPLKLIAVGSVIPGKGLDVLLDAMRELWNEPVQLEIIGPERAAPAFAAQMRRKAESLALPVRFRGALGDAELCASLESAHVFVLPSYYEGFGIVFLEAMAHGLPAVGATAGAVPRLIRNGVNGFLVTPGDAGQLAERIGTLLRDRGLLLQMSLDALRTAAAFPTWDQSTDRMRDFLVSIAGASGSRRGG
jgi:glycosyltransferase involved in cell wall biosynthesis